MAKEITYAAGGHFYAAPRGASKPTLLQRGIDWLASRRVARNDLAIERYIHEHGGVLTDSVEREIAKRFIETQPGRF
ncbi:MULTISPECIES: hypothetical protein [Rhodomicrobium]|uniref:hypothetical protein n=1 Tax=Rhodomicrobium TaxID=1068 RepID=UPI000B4AF5B1|nr:MULTISPECIES: hypothetical protein [Rhodomicrobium]